MSDETTSPIARTKLVTTPDGDHLSEYVGFVTRVVAQIFDVVVLNLIAMLLWAVFYLVLRNVEAHKHLTDAFVWATSGGWSLFFSALYFVSFWSVTGQTVGARLMGFRVVRRHGGARLGFWRALSRWIGQLICALTLGIGYLPVIVTDRRRGLHDLFGTSVVRWDQPAWANRTWAAHREQRAEQHPSAS